MDFWAENQGHLTQYKFNTIPSRSCTQNYHDRQLAPQFPVYYGDQLHKPSNSGYWPSRQVPNWTSQDATSMMPPQNFPYSYGHPVQRHYSDVGDQQRQEARDWATYQQQQERGIQRDKWSYNPTLCKRDISQKNESNFRELEAWALRYSHSLPRRRRIEAELRGARQDNIERSDLQMLNIQDSKQWDRPNKQQVPNYCQATPAFPSFEVKDKLTYQTKLYSHPPNYNAPPSYSVQFRSVSMQQKSENQNKLQQVRKQQEREMFGKCPSKVETQELDTLQINRPLVQERSSKEAAKVIEGRKFKLNKKAGGMTIFCLVSRIADPERENLPISQKQSSLPKGSDESQPLKQADEVDFKVQTPLKHARSPYSKLQAIPICQESLSKMAEKSMPKSNEVSVYEKLAVQSKYPLWRRPSCTSSTESDNASTTCSKDILDSNLQDRENGSKTVKENVQEAKDDGMMMIDTTCVVVKLEVVQGPTKEQIHYLASENQAAQDVKNSDDANEKSEGLLLEKSKSDLETLEERAKRICGLHDTTTTQVQEEGISDLDVQVLPKENDSTDETRFKGVIGLKDLHDESTKSETEHLKPEVKKDTTESNTCEKEGTSEVDTPTENAAEHNIDLDEDEKIHNSTVADNLEQVSNAEEAIHEKHEDPVDTNPTDDQILNKENEVVLTQNGSLLQVNVQNNVQLDECDNTNSFEVCENNTLPSISTDSNTEHLSDGNSNHQEASENVTEEDFSQKDIADITGNSGHGEEFNPELESNQSKEICCTVNDDSDGATDGNAIVQTCAIEHLQVDSGQGEDLPDKEILSESVQNQDKLLTEGDNEETHQSNKTQLELEPKYVISWIKKAIENSDKDMEAVTSDLEIQEITMEVIEVHCMQKGAESDAVKDVATCGSEQSEAQEQEDILEASNLNDVETDKELDSTNDSKYNDQNLKPPVIVSEVEIPLEDIEQCQEKELIENISEESQADQASCLDVSDTGSTRILSEMCKDSTQNSDQEQDDICVGNMGKQEDVLDTDDTLEELHINGKVKVTENVPVQEIANVAVLVGHDEQSKEAQTQIEIDLMLQSLVKNNASGGEVQSADLQQCELEDTTRKGEDLIEGNVKSDQDAKICQSTKKDTEISDAGLVCHSDTNVNNHASILEKSCSSTDCSLQCIPSTSTCTDNVESACCEEEGKYPKSLWDAVNRIRKHTAPDSENEEEEVMDSWDRDSLADNIVSYEQIINQGYRDITGEVQADPYDEDLNTQDDTLSQCSSSSQESDETIVDDDLDELMNAQSEELSNDNRGSEGEGTGENETQNGEAVNKSGLTEDKRSDEDAETPQEIML